MKKRRAIKCSCIIFLILVVSLAFAGCEETPAQQIPEQQPTEQQVPGQQPQKQQPPEQQPPKQQPPKQQPPEQQPQEQQPDSGGTVKAWVFDVGEALSVFIDAGDTEVLIDAGYDRDGKKISDAIADYIEDNTLEYVIATHSHSDHVGGMEDIYDAYHVAHTIYGDTGTTSAFNQFMDAVKSEGNSSFNEDADETIPLAEGVTLSIIDILDGAGNTNNNSVISVLNCNGRKMLVTGDYEDGTVEKRKTKTEEAKYFHERLTSGLRENNLYPIDVYIVGHHGSETSSSNELLALITPVHAVISSAGPDYGTYRNPDITVMERLAGAGAKTYATYRSGDIEIDFTENDILISPPDSELLTPGNYDEAA